MLSFASEFPVKESDTGKFIDAVRTWITGSPHTRLTAVDLADIPDQGRWKVDRGAVSLEALFAKDSDGEMGAFRYSAVDGNIVWVTDVVYSKSPEDDWIGIRTDRLSSTTQLTLPTAKKPLIVRTIIDKLGGGLDDEIHVSDSPYFLKETDVRMAARLLSADADNYLPIVYISCPFPGKGTVYPEPLARVLGGLAHVVVEPSRHFSRIIQREVGSRNVYGGHVGVYWPDGSVHEYYFSPTFQKEIDLRFAIVADVNAAHINRRPLDRCTWSRAEARMARLAFEALRSSGSEDINDYVLAFDSEMNAKNAQLSEAEDEILRLRGQVRSLESKKSLVGSGWNGGDEQEFKANEFNEIVRDALNQASANAQNNSRREHVLRAIADKIPQSNSLSDSRVILKEFLKNYRSMTPEIRTGLEALGFDVSDDGKHYKLVYMLDDRYTFSLPKSGSDWRGGLNSVSDIAKRVF